MADDVDERTYRWLLAVATLGGLWLTRHGLTAAVPAGTDVMGHVARADAGLHLFARGRLDGWFDTFGSGYRLFGVYGPGFTMLVGLVKLASLGTFTTARAIAVVGSLSIAAVVPTLASLSRSLGSTRRTAAIHGALGLSVSFVYGGGLAGLYQVGLLPQSVAIPILLLTASALVRAAWSRRWKPVAVGALGVAALLVTHPISVVVLAVLLPGLLLGAPHRPSLPLEPMATLRGFARAAGVASWGAAIAAFWLLPALMHRGNHGGLSGWAYVGLVDRVRSIARGELLVPQALAIAAACAIALTAGRAVRSKPARRLLIAPAWGAGAIALGHLADVQRWSPHDAWAQIPNRALTVVGYLLLLPLATLIAELADRLATTRLATTPTAVDATAIRAVASGVVAVVAFALPLVLSDALAPRQEAHAPTADLAAVAATVRRATAPSTRNLLVPLSPFLYVGPNAPARWLAVASHRPTAELYFPEATSSVGAGLLPGHAISEATPDESLDQLRRAGIGVVVVEAPSPAGTLIGQPGFQRIAVHGSLQVWAVRGDDAVPEPTQLLQPAEDAIDTTGPRLDATLTTAQVDHLRWRATQHVAGPVVAAIAYDPSWQVRIDGRSVRTTRSDEGLLRFELPRGRHRIEATYLATGNDPIAIFITVVALGALIAARPTRRRGSRASSSPSAGPSAPAGSETDA